MKKNTTILFLCLIGLAGCSTNNRTFKTGDTVTDSNLFHSRQFILASHNGNDWQAWDLATGKYVESFRPNFKR